MLGFGLAPITCVFPFLTSIESDYPHRNVILYPTSVRLLYDELLSFPIAAFCVFTCLCLMTLSGLWEFQQLHLPWRFLREVKPGVWFPEEVFSPSIYSIYVDTNSWSYGSNRSILMLSSQRGFLLKQGHCFSSVQQKELLISLCTSKIFFQSHLQDSRISDLNTIVVHCTDHFWFDVLLVHLQGSMDGGNWS